MNIKSYKVLKTVLQKPNEWVSVAELAYSVDLTYRQVLTILRTSELFENLVESHERRDFYIKLKATEEEVKKFMRNATIDCYKIDDEKIKKVTNALSTFGWLSVMDISEDSGLNKTCVTKTLSVMNNIDHKTENSVTFYKLRSDA